MFKDVDGLSLQEVHAPGDRVRRLKILGFNTIDYRGHHKHGLATYVNRRNQQLYVPSTAHF